MDEISWSTKADPEAHIHRDVLTCPHGVTAMSRLTKAPEDVALALLHHRNHGCKCGEKWLATR